MIPFSGLPKHFITRSRFALTAEDGRMTRLLRSEQIRTQGKLIILKLETIDTRDEAELTVGMGVLLCRDDLAEGDNDQMDSQQLRGLAVRLKATAEILGIIESSFSNGAHVIIVVRDEGHEYLIPLVDDIVVGIDDREVIIDPPPGLLEINQAADS